MNGEQIGTVINPGDFRMQDWLLKSDLSAGAKLTYSVLACCAGGRDYVWPSQEYLAEKVSVSVRTLQRYLSELMSFGLIEKAKKYIKGQVRNIYRFLVHSVIGLPKTETQNVVANKPGMGQVNHNIQCQGRHDNLSPGSAPVPILPPVVAKSEKILPTDTTNCTERHDNLSPSLNKEETIKGKEYNPPTPQNGPDGSQGDPTGDGSGKESEFFLEVKEEAPEWTEAKKFLEKRLAVATIQTWIAPLLFEKKATEVILRCPNPFFMSWVKSHYIEHLNSALAEAGLSDWRLELMTEEQLVIAETANQKQREKAKTEARPQENVDALAIEEQFERLYQVYPRKEKFDKGLAVFCRIGRQNALPKTSELIRAVKRGLTDNPTWQREQGRFIPQIHNWLSEKRWMD